MTDGGKGRSRRAFLAETVPQLGLAGAALAMGGPLGASDPVPARPSSVVCVGAHPDDPESGCGGTLARFAAEGSRVTVVYLTRGEAGIPGKTHAEASAVRSGEAEAACRILGASAVFAGQIDGATEFDPARTAAFIEVVRPLRPDVILTHWPLDTHPDHQVASLLAFRAYLALRPILGLYYYEVNLGGQTYGFAPNHYVDISAEVERKKAAVFAHRSQDPAEIWDDYHREMADFRGREAGVKQAEAFVRLSRIGPGGGLIGSES